MPAVEEQGTSRGAWAGARLQPHEPVPAGSVGRTQPHSARPETKPARTNPNLEPQRAPKQTKMEAQGPHGPDRLGFKSYIYLWALSLPLPYTPHGILTPKIAVNAK